MGLKIWPDTMLVSRLSFAMNCREKIHFIIYGALLIRYTLLSKKLRRTSTTPVSSCLWSHCWRQTYIFADKIFSFRTWEENACTTLTLVGSPLRRCLSGYYRTRNNFGSKWWPITTQTLHLHLGGWFSKLSTISEENCDYLWWSSIHECLYLPTYEESWHAVEWIGFERRSNTRWIYHWYRICCKDQKMKHDYDGAIKCKQNPSQIKCVCHGCLGYGTVQGSCSICCKRCVAVCVYGVPQFLEHNNKNWGRAQLLWP